MAHAGPLDAVKSWFSWTAIAFIVSAVLAMGAIGRYTPWLSKLLIASGGLVTTLGLIIADGKVTADELKDARAKVLTVRDVFKEAKTDG